MFVLIPATEQYGIEENGDQTRDNVSENPAHRLLLRVLDHGGHPPGCRTMGKFMLGPYISLIAENSTNAPYVLIGTGTTIIVFGLFGCFATCRGSPWMLKLVGGDQTTDLRNVTIATGKVHQQGCYELVTSFIETNMGIIAGVTFGIAFSQLIGMLLACCLSRFITANQYEMV
ncbi:hypothetical protein Q7C36_021160 [Tachysurus vachellii]|uniref:Uncharacterized protein n=1 Tax=Tachysurus vachellii TaxID=175792 RepID=A0AA88LNC5_TACVA|nr:hypothetical protein Q7C36_021160 [Tachysurus vachellii]